MNDGSSYNALIEEVDSDSKSTIEVLKPAFYLTTNNVVSTIGLIICMNMLATLGDDELAASALISSSEMVIIGIATGALRAVGTLAGESYGALEDESKIEPNGSLVPFSRSGSRHSRINSPALSRRGSFQNIESPNLTQPALKSPRRYSVNSEFGIGIEAKFTRPSSPSSRSSASSLQSQRSFSVTQAALLPLTSSGGSPLAFPRIQDANFPEEIHEINAVYQQGIVLSLATSVPIIGIAWFIDPILQFLGQDKDLSQIVSKYFHAAALSIPLMSCRMNCQMIIFGTNQHPVAVVTTFLGTLLQMGFAYMFVRGKWGVSSHGVAGLGYAIVLAELVSLIIYHICFGVIPKFRRFNLFAPRILCAHKSTLKALWTQGWPMLVRISAELLSIFAATAFIGGLGDDSLSAQQIASQYVFMLAIPFNALSQGISILISQFMGGEKFSKIRKIGFIGMSVGAAIGLISLIISILIPDQLASFYFNSDTQNKDKILDILKTLLPFSMAGQVFDGIQNVASGALYGIEDTQIPMLSLITSLWVIKIPLALLLGLKTPLGVNGVALSHSLALMLNSIFLAHRWHIKSNKIIEEKQNIDHSLPSLKECLPVSKCCSALFSKTTAKAEKDEMEKNSGCFTRLYKYVFGSN